MASRCAGLVALPPTLTGRRVPVKHRLVTADGVDLTSGDDDPTRKLIRQVLGAVAEFEKRVLVLKLRAARERVRKRTGRCEGRKPYGTHSGERVVIARMRQLRRKPVKGRRASFAAVATSLNGEGHRNRAGRVWSAQMVHHVLARAKSSSFLVRALTLRPRPTRDSDGRRGPSHDGDQAEHTGRVSRRVRRAQPRARSRAYRAPSATDSERPPRCPLHSCGPARRARLDAPATTLLPVSTVGSADPTR